MSIKPVIEVSPSRRIAIVMTAIGGGLAFEFIWSIAGVALAHMQGTFSATPDQISWVMTAFIMGSVITIACTGWLANRFGRKQVFLIALFGFGITLMMCGSATTIEQEVAWRFAQGLFGAPLLPLSQAITVDAFPPDRHGSATAIWTFGIIGGAVLGPAAGGIIVETISWPWVFYLNIPLTILVFLAAIFVLPPSKPNSEHPLDWLGLFAIIIFVTAFQIALSRGERLDWFDSYEIIIELSIGTFALYAFIVHSLTTDKPFFRPALFRDLNYSVGLIAAFANGAIATVPLVILPLMLEHIVGLSVSETGMLLLSRGLGLMIASALLARYDKLLPFKWVLIISFILSLISGYMMAEWTDDVSVEEIFWVNMVSGFSSGAIFIAINTLTFSTLRNDLKTEGFALYYTILFAGSTIGIAAIVAVLTRMSQVARSVVGAHVNPFNQNFKMSHIPEFWNTKTLEGLQTMENEVIRQAEMIAYSDAFLAAALIALVGIPLALLFRTPKATQVENT